MGARKYSLLNESSLVVNIKPSLMYNEILCVHDRFSFIELLAAIRHYVFCPIVVSPTGVFPASLTLTINSFPDYSIVVGR